MAATFTPQDLYGGAVKAIIPQGWLDASNFRQIPNHQELFLSRTTLSTLITEINERVSQETALASLLHPQNTTLRSAIFGPANPEHTSETVDKAAVLYHLNDLLDGNGDGDGGDEMRVVVPPARVSMRKFQGVSGVSAYRGVVVMDSSSSSSSSSSSYVGRGGERRVRSGSGGEVPASIGGAAAGSSAEGAGALGSGLRVSMVSCHYLLVRLEEQETDVLVLFNVPLKEFDERGDARGLAREEELASETIEGFVEALEVVDWRLFGG